MSSEIKVRKDESLDSALRRFKRSCQKSGVLAECRKREHYEKPSVKRKKKSEAARKNNRKRSYSFRLCDITNRSNIFGRFFCCTKNHSGPSGI